ncbi:MAG: carboxynorspermidine decarboxylase [Oscillospiraceae bacterium]
MDELHIDLAALPTPCYLIDEQKLIDNLKLLARVRAESGAKILLAQKAFSMFSVYPLIAQYLDGTTASGIFEARLGFEELGKPFSKETHVYAPAFKEADVRALARICDKISFNSPAQLYRFAQTVKESGRAVSVGIRVNPEYSEIETELYNPCAAFSRLGTTLAEFEQTYRGGADGLHFHTLCEQGADVLARTLDAFEARFGKYLSAMKWVNFGGGHHITRANYDVDLLIACVKKFREKYGVAVYIEPGEAVALDAGYLVSEVLDVRENGMNLAIIDTSAACHMPDVLEMPYRPRVIGSGLPDEKEHTYRLGGPTCLAGDIIGDYSFDKPLRAGDRLVFCDMAIYSMVKNNTFNGMPLPSIMLKKADGTVSTVREFDFDDFKSRL